MLLLWLIFLYDVDVAAIVTTNVVAISTHAFALHVVGMPLLIMLCR
jgi:hypothetical protein